MMNFNFDFSDNSENYYNQFNVKPHIQVQDINVNTLIDKMWADEDLSIYEEVPEVLSMTAHVLMRACKVYDVNKIGKTDSRMHWKYMKNNGIYGKTIYPETNTYYVKIIKHRDFCNDWT